MGWFKNFREKRKAKKLKKKKLKNKKLLLQPMSAAVIVAAGSSTRMEGVDKIFAPINGVPVLARTLLEFEHCEMISEIIVVTSENSIIDAGNLCRDFEISKVSKIVCGGETRTDSVLNGLLELAKDSEIVAIHDGARPLVSQEIIKRAIRTAAKYSAAAPAVQVVDTIKVVEQGVVASTPDRSTLYAVQTPQVFVTSLIKGALTDAVKAGAELTDDCSAVERLGGMVRITKGSDENIKITVPADIIKAEAILKAREENVL